MARLVEIIKSIFGNLGLEVPEASGEAAHVHPLLSGKPDCNLCRFVHSAKTVISRLLEKEFPEIRESLRKG